MGEAAKEREAGGRVPSLPPGVRVYAIGDIHGHPALLDRMMALVERDLAENPHAAPVEVFLGDFVDRGPDSRGVLERLSRPPAEGRTRVCLKGNHEEAFLAFLEDPDGFGRWASFGGLETLASYGVPLRFLHGAADAEACRRALL